MYIVLLESVTVYVCVYFDRGDLDVLHVNNITESVTVCVARRRSAGYPGSKQYSARVSNGVCKPMLHLHTLAVTSRVSCT